MDQFYYFNIELDDVDAVQSVPGALEAAAEEGARVLAEQGDIYTASLIKAGIEDEFNSKLLLVVLSLKLNAIEKVEEGFLLFYMETKM